MYSKILLQRSFMTIVTAEYYPHCPRKLKFHEFFREISINFDTNSNAWKQWIKFEYNHKRQKFEKSWHFNPTFSKCLKFNKKLYKNPSSKFWGLVVKKNFNFSRSWWNLIAKKFLTRFPETFELWQVSRIKVSLLFYSPREVKTSLKKINSISRK